MSGWSSDPVERGWAAQAAAAAAYDEASLDRWNRDYDEYREPAARPYRSRSVPPVCAHGCSDPWTTDPACDVHATEKERTND